MQKLHEEETEFMRVTQPWQDELADLAQKFETKPAKFRETQAIVGKLFAEQVTRESLEQVKGSVSKKWQVCTTKCKMFTPNGMIRQTRSSKSARSKSDAKQQVARG